MGINSMFCCGSIPAMYSPIEDLFELIDRDCSHLPPGLRRESRDEEHDTSDRPLTKTAGNALHEAPPPSQSPQRVSGKISVS
mmetsp:Transcript_136/g.312  ORF Transcript_136/g.312 Transcript_136/m.312 type:complete len:82 (-) Transcript_136:590-835(-)